MTTVSLNGTWQLSHGPQTPGSPRKPADIPPGNWQTIPATVPGTVELDLIAAGKLPELSVGSNILKTRELETHDWCYRRSFPSPSLQPGQRAWLVFEGLDCIATIFLNGHEIGAADNMLVAHRFDITDHLKAEGENELFVRILSPILHARQFTVSPGDYAFMTNFESLHVRKASHMYGWDILPRLVSAGIWRDVKIEIVNPAHFRQVYFATHKTDPAKHTARVLVDWDFATDRLGIDDLKIRIMLRNPGGPPHQSEHHVVHTHGRALVNLTDARLWWPRGYGEAHLYELSVELLDKDGAVLDAYQTNVGIRTVHLERTDLTNAAGQGEFVFVINGQKIFVKGTNWVPLDALHSRDGQHLDAAMQMIADLNSNMIRCWGGNVYEDHAFFDACDKLGVMVWQDFSLACAIYPQDDTFARAIRREASAVVQKLRNHASLVLWAGNNEIDEFYAASNSHIDPNTDRLSREVLPAVVRQYDAIRPYLPSSPYRAPAFYTQNESNFTVQPEQHLWGPRNDFKGSFYTSSAAHFVSEIGYHGCPNISSLKQMMDADHLWPWQNNEQWLIHATRPHPHMHDYDYRIELMAKQINVLFTRTPDNLEDFVLASQISQAEAKKFFIEWFRQAKWRRTGVLWWNLRDGWPVISDAAVDYYNRRKLAYEYIKRSQQSVCGLIAEPTNRVYSIMVTNDTLKGVKGTLSVRDVDAERTLHDGPFEVGINGIAIAGKLPVSEKLAAWDIRWTLADGTTGRNHYIAGPRPFELPQYRNWMEKLDLAFAYSE